jgi:hypothetical protein
MTVFGGDPILAADMNRAQQRVVGTPTESTADLSAISSATNVIIDSVTVNLEIGRRYKVSAYIPYSVSATTDNHYLLLCEDSVSGAQLTYATVREGHTTRVAAKTVWCYYTAVATAAKTFVSCTRRADGSGSITPKGATSQKRILTVETADS